MKLAIILGSTRQGRLGERVAAWAVDTATQTLPDAEISLLDLQDYPMPFITEAISPRYNPNRQPLPEVQKWLDAVAAADAYVFITPEYNRTIPAVLKNALDYLAFEGAKKPATVLSYSSGPAGGLAAAQHLRTIINPLEIIPMPTIMIVGKAAEVLSESGEMNEEVKANPYGPHATLQNALKELKWYSDALTPARAALQAA